MNNKRGRWMMHLQMAFVLILFPKHETETITCHFYFVEVWLQVGKKKKMGYTRYLVSFVARWWRFLVLLHEGLDLFPHDFWLVHSRNLHNKTSPPPKKKTNSIIIKDSNKWLFPTAVCKTLGNGSNKRAEIIWKMIKVTIQLLIYNFCFRCTSFPISIVSS